MPIGNEWHLTWVFAFRFHTYIALRCNQKLALQTTNCTFNSSKERAHPTRRLAYITTIACNENSLPPRYDHEADDDDDDAAVILSRVDKKSQFSLSRQSDGIDLLMEMHLAWSEIGFVAKFVE